MLVAVQIFSFCACLISAVCKDKKNILTWVFIANVSNFLVMLLAKELDGWGNSLATVIRGFLFMYRDKFKCNNILYLCLAMHISAFVFSYQNAWSILLGVATVITCSVQWLGNSKQVKLGSIIAISCWILYTIHIGLWLDLPKRIVELLFTVISLCNLLRLQKKNVLIET